MKVKFSFFVLTFMLLYYCCVSITVNSFAEIEDLYLARKLKSIQNGDTLEDDPYSRLTGEQKEAQCEKVLSTTFFTSSVRNLVYADKNDREVFEELSQYPEVRNFHYDIEYENGSLKNLKFKPKYPYDTEFKVWIKSYSKTTAQFMFACLAKNTITQVLQTYLISYGFADGEGFLFGYSTDDKLIVLALIEEAPISLTFEGNTNLQTFYAKQTETADTNPSLVDAKTNDPICNLQEFEKERLCAVIFDSEFYVKEEVKFNIAKFNVDYECKTTPTIIFTESGVETKLNVNSISCKGIKKKGAPITYEVSAGFDGNNSVFTFKTVIVKSPFIISWIAVERRFLELDAYIKDVTVLRDANNNFDDISFLNE